MNVDYNGIMKNLKKWCVLDQPTLKKKILEETIYVHVEAEKNTKSVVLLKRKLPLRKFSSNYK